MARIITTCMKCGSTTGNVTNEELTAIWEHSVALRCPCGQLRGVQFLPDEVSHALDADRMQSVAIIDHLREQLYDLGGEA